MIGRYEQLVERAPEGIVVHDGERILEVNAALLRLTGALQREQLVGQPVSVLLERPYLRAVAAQLQKVRPELAVAPVMRDRMHRVDGEVRDVEVRAQLFLESGVPMAHVVLWDITKRVEAENVQKERALRVQTQDKLVEIRMLAGGVAHEINNLLQIILGFAGVLGEEPMTRAQQTDIAEIVSAASRGAKITKHLLEYSQQAPHAPTSVDLGEVVQRIVDTIPSDQTNRNVRVRVADAYDGVATLDPQNLRQMLEHLVANAHRATHDRGEVSVTVQGTVTTAVRTSSDGHRMPAGAYGTVSVHDTGEGMSPEVQRQIFTPFFTTGGVGKGAGLGLSAVQGMAAQNGGFLTCESAVHEGTTFTLWFPMVRADA